MFNSKKELADFIRKHSKDEKTYLTLLNVFSNTKVEKIQNDILSVINKYIQMNEQLIEIADNKLNKIADDSNFPINELYKVTEIKKKKESLLNEKLLLKQLYDWIEYEINKESIENNFLSGDNLEQSDTEIKKKLKGEVLEINERLQKFTEEIRKEIITYYEKGYKLNRDILGKFICKKWNDFEYQELITKKKFHKDIWGLLIADKKTADIIIEKIKTKNIKKYISTIIKNPVMC